jgi:N-acetylmuramoyl-L-alanine amidase
MTFRKLERVDYIVVHCSATPPNVDIGVAEIREWHQKQNGWLDIGYHFVIRRNGQIERGRPVDVQGSHARGFNDRSIGICLVGGVKRMRHAGNTSVGFVTKDVPDNNFTPAQFEELAHRLFVLKLDHPKAEVLGHRDLPKVAKACPSFDVREWLKERQRICLS